MQRGQSTSAAQTSEIAFPKNGRAEAWLREDHHARRALDQVRAGAGTHDEKKGIRHASMQPHN